MFEQLTQLVNQFGINDVVKNDAIPNEKNDAVLHETSNTILDSLKQMAANGNVSEIASLFEGNNAANSNNPVVQQLTEKLTGKLGQKLGINSATAANLATSLIPKVLGSLIGDAKNPNKTDFNISDIIESISGGNGGGLMDAVSKYGGQFGLDQNNDGKVDMSDATEMLSKKSGGLGGIFGKLFGK